MLERKWLAHFIDASFGGATPEYIRLGEDLEEYNEELNPQVEVNQNIIGNQKVRHNGYQVQSEVSPYYAYEDDPLFEKLAEIANERKTGDDCKTTKVDVLLDSTGAVQWAYKEDVYLIPNSLGGDTSGVQIPFTVYNDGNREKGTFDMSTKKFTPSTGG